MNKTISITLKGKRFTVDGQKTSLKQFIDINQEITKLKNNKKTLALAYYDLYNKHINGLSIDTGKLDSLVTGVNDIDKEIDTLQKGKYDELHALKRKEILYNLKALESTKKDILKKSVFDPSKGKELAKVFKKKLELQAELESHGDTRIMNALMAHADVSEGKTPDNENNNKTNMKNKDAKGKDAKGKDTKGKDAKNKDAKGKDIKNKKDVLLSPNTKMQIKNNIKDILKKVYRFKDKSECVSKQRSKPFYMSKDEILSHIATNEELQKLMPANFKKLTKEQLCEYFFA